MAKLTFLHFLLIFSCYNLCQTINVEHKKQSGFSLKMLHWNSPELPSHKPNRTREQLMDELLHISNVRVKVLKHYLNVLNSSYHPNVVGPIRPRLESISSRGLFLVQIGIGTFHSNTFQQNYLALETGNDYTWTQCEDCSPCFHQRGPLFSYSHSATYHFAPCGQCPGSCQSDHCFVSLPYGDGGYIAGFKARETFTFEYENGRYKQIPDMDFICVTSSLHYKETATQNDIESGVLGLGRQGYLDLMRPIHDPEINDGRFSYCFPPLDEPIQQPMYLRFGQDIGHRMVRPYQSTPIIPGPPGTPFYYINLVGLSVGNQRLNLNAPVFRLHSDGSGGCYIETSIPMSYLPRYAYYVFELALTQQYELMNRGLVTRLNPSPLATLPLCYEATDPRSDLRTPKITFHLGGRAKLEVQNPMGYHTYNGHGRLHCSQILPDTTGTDIAVIGALQQVNHRFVYDTRRSQLIFLEQHCADYN